MKARLISLDYLVPHCDTRLRAFPAVLGRDCEADIPLDDPLIAGRHCEIDRQDNRLVVRDLGTVHGTYVNGSPVTEAELATGDHLSLGQMTFLVECFPNRDEEGLYQEAVDALQAVEACAGVA
jgi:pSer/pThr/pTyr-binding forkhead associated (FHA) protein